MRNFLKVLFCFLAFAIFYIFVLLPQSLELEKQQNETLLFLDHAKESVINTYLIAYSNLKDCFQEAQGPDFLSKISECHKNFVLFFEKKFFNHESSLEFKKSIRNIYKDFIKSYQFSMKLLDKNFHKIDMKEIEDFNLQKQIRWNKAFQEGVLNKDECKIFEEFVNDYRNDHDKKITELINEILNVLAPKNPIIKKSEEFSEPFYINSCPQVILVVGGVIQQN